MFGIISEFYPLWVSSQVPLYEVKRWGTYLNDKKYGSKMRKQSTLEHIHSFCIFADAALIQMMPYFPKVMIAPLDQVLLMRSFRIHDHGEGLMKRDIPELLKDGNHDLEEYVAFMEHIKGQPQIVQKEFQYAFLLQFALDNPPSFPDEAREIMKRISKRHYFEAMSFKALERFEYSFYAYEMKDKNPNILPEVIERQFPHYQMYKDQLPGFEEVLFTEPVRKWMLSLIRSGVAA